MGGSYSSSVDVNQDSNGVRFLDPETISSRTPSGKRLLTVVVSYDIHSGTAMDAIVSPVVTRKSVSAPVNTMLRVSMPV